MQIVESNSLSGHPQCIVLLAESGAALDAHVEARIVRRLTASADHPVLLDFPEGEYLKGLVCQIG